MMRLGTSNNLYVKMKPGHIPEAVDFINKTFKSFDPGLPLDFHFLEDDFDKLYKAEERMGKIVGYFSYLAVIISCLGLIGLSSFLTECRTKEIGIRKINGAKSTEIFRMLSKEYVIWVGISILIAWPIAWLAMHKWLQNFAYRTTIQWWIFLLAGCVALLVAFLTVSYQSSRAASRNPVEALRYE
jgi:putative ABC transport system permease protein